MVWHIFRKDLKLMWPAVVGVALLDLIFRIILSTADHFANGRSSPLLSLSFALGDLGVLAIAFLVVMVTQADAIPGLRQDWLVRPIGRLDLFLSKLFFVVLAVQFPIFVIEVGQGLAAGFPVGQSLSAPLLHSLMMLFALELPVLAFATLTRNISEVAGATIAIVVCVALFVAGTTAWNFQGAQIWVADALRTALGLAGAVVVLVLQYRWRKTKVARAIASGTLVVWMFAVGLPWKTAFAVEEHLSARPDEAKSVQIAFEPREGFRGGVYRFAPPGVPLRIIDVPLRVSGIPEGWKLLNHQFSARLRGPAGETVDLGTERVGNWFLETQQPITVPQPVYDRFQNQPVRLELDYALTLLKPNPAQPIPAVNGERMISDAGSCATRVNYEEGWIDLRCTSEGNPPCATWFLQNPLTGERDGEGTCSSDFAPWVERIDRDSMNHYGGDLHFRDEPGSLPHPVNQTQLKDAQVMVRVYRPEAHFTRTVTIPNLRLSDWRVK